LEGNLKGRESMENVGVDGSIILSWISEKKVSRCRLNSIVSLQDPMRDLK
jgi:hypothetical protein